MIALAAPLGLAALAALALPIVIHLIRRAEEREVQFAALRWIGERVGPATRWRLHEPLLLALRLLLIVAIALLLALPFWRRPGEPGAPWVAVAPGVDARAARAAVGAPAAEWRWLAPGFPRVERGRSGVGDGSDPAPTPVASLVRELDAELPETTALTVVVPAEIGGLDGERLRLGREVDWRVVDGRSPQAAQAPSDAPIRVAVRGGEEGEGERVVVDALTAAWRTAGAEISLDAAPSDAPVPPDTDWLFWLGGRPTTDVEAWIGAGGVAVASQAAATDGVVLMTDDNGAALLRERTLGRGRVLATPVALTTQAMPALLAPDFPVRLRELMSAAATPPDRASAPAMTPGRRDVTAAGSILPLDRGLAILVALLFLAERLRATRQRGAKR